MKPVHIGVIGCGAMGMSVVRSLLRCDERLRIVALYDPDERSVNRARRELSSPPPDSCGDFREIVERPDVPWVMIASWNRYHCEQIIAAFESGKHVFCQKPLAMNLEESVRLREAWERSGRMFNIGFTLRYSPHYRRIKQLIAEGRIGRIISMEFNETLDFNHGGYIMGDWRRLRRNAGTHLLEKCCHDIDLANWMTESRARRVASFGGLDFFVPKNAHHVERIGKSGGGKPAYSGWEGLINLNPFESDKDIVDNQVAIIEYESGVRATFHTNCNAAIPERRMYIVGEEGTIRADVLAGTIQLKRIGFDTKIEDLSAGSAGIHGGGDDVLASELADSMLNGTPPSVGFEEGVRSAATCFAMDEAMDTGTVVDVGPYWKKLDRRST